MTVKRRVKAAWWGFRNFEQLGWVLGCAWENVTDDMDIARQFDDEAARVADLESELRELEGWQEWLKV